MERGESVSGYPLVTGKDFAYPLGQGEEARLVTKLVLSEEKSSAGTEARASAGTKTSTNTSSFGLKGVIIMQLGGKEIGRVPVYTPSQLPPETSPYEKKYSPAGGTAYPADNWLQAFGSALRALFKSGEEHR